MYETSNFVLSLPLPFLLSILHITLSAFSNGGKTKQHLKATCLVAISPSPVTSQDQSLITIDENRNCHSK